MLSPARAVFATQAPTPPTVTDIWSAVTGPRRKAALSEIREAKRERTVRAGPDQTTSPVTQKVT